MVILAHLHVGFFTIFFIKRALLKRFYLSLKLLQSRPTFKQKVNHKVSSHYISCMKFFTTSNSKNIIATLGIVTIEKSELTFLLILYYHDNLNSIIWLFPYWMNFVFLYCRFSWAGNWELVKPIVGTKFRWNHVCLHSQARNRLWQPMTLLFLKDH